MLEFRRLGYKLKFILSNLTNSVRATVSVLANSDRRLVVPSKIFILTRLNDIYTLDKYLKLKYRVCYDINDDEITKLWEEMPSRVRRFHCIHLVFCSLYSQNSTKALKLKGSTIEVVLCVIGGWLNFKEKLPLRGIITPNHH